MLSKVDHLVYATPDLDSGVASIERLLGCPVVPGGRHQDWGTRNALVSLGDTAYLEIIGPDPDATFDGPVTLFGIDTLESPRLVTWAAKGQNLESVVVSGSAAGVDLGSVSGGSRVLPDGSTLAWRLTDPFAERISGVVPFFIDWDDGRHPAGSLPRACELIGLTITHPDAPRAGRVLQKLDLAVPISAGEIVRITATILTPTGIVELS